MPRFKLPQLAELAGAMGFTPVARRLEQLAAAEQLLAEIDADKAYPADFVIYRITGYHPRKSDEKHTKAGSNQTLLTGIALQHDLGLLIETVSDTAGLIAADQCEPVLDINAAAARFDVSTKSIQRWRRKGLAARMFLFPDGKKRVGFLLSSIERYVHGNGAATQPMTPREMDAVVRNARRLSKTCIEEEVCRRIARQSMKAGRPRSPMAVLHVLRWYDEAHPDDRVFVCRKPISKRNRRRVLRGAKRGVSVATMARKLRRPRAMVARVIVDAEARRLAKRKAKFIDDELFRGDDAEATIEALVKAETLAAEAEPVRVPRDLPPYLADLYRTPLLTPARERALFLQYNFYRYRFTQLRKRFDPMLASRRDLEKLKAEAKRATAVKNQIVKANLRLVVSVARKHLRPTLDLMELVSDGNVVLMRAVEGFDVSKGNKFSTYATLALMKGFARSVPAMQSKAAALQAPTRRDTNEFTLDPADTRAAGFLDVQRADEVRELLGRLDATERDVLMARAGVCGDCDGLRDDDAATLDQLAQRLGVSKHRVREIERSALVKLRA
ncbi:MAG: sigma-70 family RNA polymerase sigma factor [Planctomycetota bacterium]